MTARFVYRVRVKQNRIQYISQRLTAQNHHEDGKYLFRLGEGVHVAETNAGHAGQREVERGDVSHCVRWSSIPDYLPGRVAHDVVVANVAAQRLQPPVEDAVMCLDVANGKPDAGEPVSDEDEHNEQQSEHGRSVLNVQVQLTSNSSQTQ